MVCVRFAPSPTGHLHIGGVRTALFNFLYARSQKGKFLLRIEDTDQERSRAEYEEEILKSLSRLGIEWDGEVRRQSERLETYARLAHELVQQGLAYVDHQEGKSAVRFKMPARKALFHDLVHGPVEFDAALFEDLVILKSDGYPTYHWACVIDDHEMEITHVIRGDDHLSNTPRQILLFEAMGWKPPKYAHLPLIVGHDGSPLSKRHGAVALSAFADQGFFPGGILNYLALLGWGSDDNQEIYTLEQLIEKFSLKRVNKTNARFNYEKLEWVNAQHIKRLSDDEYLSRLSFFFPEESRRFSKDVWRRLCLLYKGRIKTFGDLRVQGAYCFEDPAYALEVAQPFYAQEGLEVALSEWLHEVETRLPDFPETPEWERVTREAADRRGVPAKNLIHPLRFALTGTSVSPGLFELMNVLGKETCLRRVRAFLCLDPQKKRGTL